MASQKDKRGPRGPRKNARRPERGEEEEAQYPPLPDGRPGRVIAHHGVAVLVHFDAGEEDQVWLQPHQRAVVGDRVRVENDRLGVEPARGVLRRRDARGRNRTIATNLNFLGIVVAPEPREPPGYIDRGFVIARAAEIEPVLIMNKTDLDPDATLSDRLEEIYSPSCTFLRVCADSGAGLEAIEAILAPDHLGALVGPSGVGKSSLLNALVPDLDLRVSELNRGSGKGRHTTTTATLHGISGGGFLVDTAGFKDFIAVDVDPLEAAAYFPGFEAGVAAGCRFRNCIHKTEPDCGVLAALEAGDLAESRHRAYLQLLEEFTISQATAGRS